MIELRNIKKVFHQGKANEFWGLRGIDITIPARRVTVIQGPSGSGKTTLLSIIGCMSRPTSGRVTLDGTLISNLPEHFMAQIRLETFGFVFQQYHLIRGLTVLENVMLPAYPLGKSPSTLTREAHQLLTELGLESKGSLKVEYLSGGEAQRTAIARALINHPKVIIADEPTANLDGELTMELLSILENFKHQEKTLIISSHDPRITDSGLADHRLLLRDGIVERAL